MKTARRFSIIIAIAMLIQCTGIIGILNVHAANTLRIQMFNSVRAPESNSINPCFRIYNDGSSSINLSDVKIRYYYTIDGVYGQSFWCDWSSVGNANVSGSFVSMSSPATNANYYLEIKFGSGAGYLAAGSNIEVQARFSKNNWTNYNQADDYSFDSSSSAYVDCHNVTGYVSGSKVWGNEPLVVPSPTATNAVEKRFLVIASNPIFGYCSTEINQYMADLTNEGWSPRLITVNNVDDDTATYDCINAQNLKSLIKGFYMQGFQGFVLIGSNPAIPDVKYLYNGEIIPTDLFYADMNGLWSDSNSDGIYDDNGWIYNPELIYGRISAGGICGFDTAIEGRKIAGYLTKIHDYRASGKQLAFAPKAFMYIDDDWTYWMRVDSANVRKLEQQLNCVTNKETTNKDKLLEMLTGGYRFGWMTVHSVGTIWNVSAWPYGAECPPSIQNPDITTINNSTIKTNYLHLNSCFASDFTKENLGAAFLFNNIDSYKETKNSYVYNITGETYSYYFNLDDGYFEDLKSNCIGIAFKNMIARKAVNDNLVSKAILLGDPTLTYSFSKPANKAPRITTDLSQVDAFAGKPFKLSFSTEDAENDAVTVEVTNLPSGATYNQTTRTISWTPLASQAGTSYSVTVTAYNKDSAGNAINKYVEDFKIAVSRIINPVTVELTNSDFESVDSSGKPLNWTLSIPGSPDLYCDSTVKYAGNYSAKILNTSNNSKTYYRNLSLEPNTYYLLSGYIKTSGGVDPMQDYGACLSIYDANMNSYRSTSVNGTQNWTPVYLRYYSGNNTSIKIYCDVFQGSATSTAWFDSIKLEKEQNFGFELPCKDITSSPSKWKFFSANTDPDTFSISALDSNYRHSGLYSVRIAAKQAMNYSELTNSKIAVKANTNYRVSVWLKTDGTITGQSGAFLAVKNGTTTVRSAETYTSSTWKQVSVTFNSGSNTEIDIICGIGKPTSFATGVALFDDVTVETI